MGALPGGGRKVELPKGTGDTPKRKDISAAQEKGLKQNGGGRKKNGVGYE